MVHSGHNLPKSLHTELGVKAKEKKGFCFVLSLVCKESHFVKVSHPYWYLTSNLSILSFNVMLATIGSWFICVVTLNVQRPSFP